MAPEPARAEIVRAAALQRGSCAAEIGAVDVGRLDAGVADVLAAVVGTGPTDARRADDGPVNDGPVDDGPVDEVRDGDLLGDAAVIVAAAEVVAIVAGSELDEPTRLVTCCEADRPELQALASAAIVNRPMAAPVAPRRDRDQLPVEPPWRSEPPGIS